MDYRYRTSTFFRTKKALKAAVEKGDKIEVLIPAVWRKGDFRPNGRFRVTVPGRYTARVLVKDHAIVEVS